MAGYRIGIISDTHGLLRPEVLQALEGCDAILHGGDVGSGEILDRLKDIGPVWAVRGNIDDGRAGSLPETLWAEFGGVRFYMIHNRRKIEENMDEADVIVCGHSHMYEERREIDGGRSRLWLNPGSCGPRRFRLPVTMALMEIGENQELRVSRIEIPAAGSGRGKGSLLPAFGTAVDEAPANGISAGEVSANGIPADIRRRIPGIIKDMDRGRSLEEIARRAGVSRELAEQICRLYVTHPGVDVDGIMRRLGL